MHTPGIARIAALAFAAAWLACSAGSALTQGAPPWRHGRFRSRRPDGRRPGQRQEAGSTITVTVVRDAKGEYVFPAGRLEPGNYQLKIRAAGYALDGAGSAEILGQTATADLKLKPAPISPRSSPIRMADQCAGPR